MNRGFGYWWDFDGSERDYRRMTWVDEHLCRDIEDPEMRRHLLQRDLRNLASDIESAVQRGATREGNDLRYYASRVRHELAALEGSVVWPTQ
jgi:hypothetical protein